MKNKTKENQQAKPLTKGIYIMTHKEISGGGISRYPKGRKVMIVGANGRKVPEGYYSDYDEKLDNISAKNSNYCELTGQYFIEKHDNSDILGLEHYRRLFTKSKYFSCAKPLTDEDIDKLMLKYDLILPTRIRIFQTNKKAYACKHFGKDFEILRKIIEKDYPEYLGSFDKFSNSKVAHYKNMFIGKREIIQNYSKWLFDILQKLENRINITCRDTYQKRVFGFASERLFNVYLLNHPEIKICQRKENLLKNIR